MHRSAPLLLSLIVASLAFAGCDPVTAPARDGGQSDADPNTPDADPSAPDAGSNPALCGNGDPDTGESCDDGNNTSGDGCSAVCLSETQNCTPTKVGPSYPLGADGGRMIAEGNFLYVTGSPNIANPVFRVLDVANPASIGEKSFFNHDAGDYPNSRVGDLVKSGNRVWLVGSDPAITSLNLLADGANALGKIKLNPSTDGHAARAGANHIIVAQNAGDSGGAIFEVSTTTAVGKGNLGSTIHYNVGASSTLMFGSTSGGNIEVFSSASNPESTGIQGVYTHATAWTTASAVREILSDGDLMVFSSTGDGGGIHIVDVGIPSTPQHKATIAGTPNDIALVGKYLYVPRNNGVQVYDLGDPINPALAGSFVQTGFVTNNLAVDGDRVYLLAESALIVVTGLPGTCTATCGNNTREYPEACDDGNHDGGDGCNATCSGN